MPVVCSRERIEYRKAEHVRFIQDMETAGLSVRLYHGRFFWHGPAVVVDNIQRALSNTKVPCQWDNLGLQYVVYPTTSDHTLENR